MRRSTRLGLLLVAVAVVVAAQLTTSPGDRTTSSGGGDEGTRAVLAHHDRVAAVRLHRVGRADRALRHTVDVWWAVGVALAALVGAWVVRSSRRAARSDRIVVAFRRRGPPPLLPLVV